MRVRSELERFRSELNSKFGFRVYFPFLIMRCLFQWKMQYLAIFTDFQRKRVRGRKRNEYRISVKLLRTN